MEIKQMILLDRFLGQFVCYFLYHIQSAGKIFQRSPKNHNDNKNLKKAIVLKFWGMGSILLATPAIAILKRKYPGVEITMVTLQQNKRFCELIKDIDRTITLSLSPIHRFPFNFLKLIKALRKDKYDLLIDLEFGVNFSAIVTFFINATEKTGFDAVKYWRGKLYIKKIPFDHGRHICGIFNKIVKSIDGLLLEGDYLSDYRQIFKLNPDRESRFIRRLRDDFKISGNDYLIVMNINASSLNQNRRWPLGHYVDLTRDLIKVGRNKVALIGSLDDGSYVKKFISHFADNPDNGKIIDLSGLLKIEELLYLIKNCGIFIGNDSGPLHIACAFDRPTVSFFGPETPMLYGPKNNGKNIVFYKDIYCSPCLNIYNSKTFICHDNQCMKLISPEEVGSALKNIAVL